MRRTMMFLGLLLGVFVLTTGSGLAQSSIVDTDERGRMSIDRADLVAFDNPYLFITHDLRVIVPFPQANQDHAYSLATADWIGQINNWGQLKKKVQDWAAEWISAHHQDPNSVPGWPTYADQSLRQWLDSLDSDPQGLRTAAQQIHDLALSTYAFQYVSVLETGPGGEIPSECGPRASTCEVMECIDDEFGTEMPCPEGQEGRFTDCDGPCYDCCVYQG